MHQGEHVVTLARAAALIADQMPDLAHLGLRLTGQSGTDNVLIRLGPGLIARFPRLPHAEAQIDLLARFLPGLQGLPLPLPLIDRRGLPGLGYPFAWTVGPFLPGRDAGEAPLDLMGAAEDMAVYLKALHGTPLPGDLPRRDIEHRLDWRLGGAEHFIGQITEVADLGPLYRFLDAARRVPVFAAPPVWVHGDLHPLNLLVDRGRVSAVIDWGSMGAGDPGMDYMLAWTLFDPASRARFKAFIKPDQAAWDRGRAFAFGKAVAALPYYRISNTQFHGVMRRVLEQVLLDAWA